MVNEQGKQRRQRQQDKEYEAYLQSERDRKKADYDKNPQKHRDRKNTEYQKDPQKFRNREWATYHSKKIMASNNNTNKDDETAVQLALLGHRQGVGEAFAASTTAANQNIADITKDANQKIADGADDGRKKIVENVEGLKEFLEDKKPNNARVVLAGLGVNAGKSTKQAAKASASTSTNSKASKKKGGTGGSKGTAKGKKTARKPRQQAIIPSTIVPSLAMRPDYYNKCRDDVLLLGHGSTEKWVFDLKEHLEPMKHGNKNHNLYFIGYRGEERPTIKELSHGLSLEEMTTRYPEMQDLDGANTRVDVPYFVVHALPQTMKPPLYFVAENQEQHEEELKTLDDIKCYWEDIFTFPNGTHIYMLKSSVRQSKRSLQSDTRPSQHAGAYVYFPQPVAWSEATSSNLFESCIVHGREKDYPFVNDIWFDFVKPFLEEKISSGELPPWHDFVKSGADWSVVPFLGVECFFRHYGVKNPRSEYKDNLLEKLSEALEEQKAKWNEKDEEYTDFVELCKVEKSRHFKVYPENEFLQYYLAAGGRNKISPCIPRGPGEHSVLVYPHVPPLAYVDEGDDGGDVAPVHPW